MVITVGSTVAAVPDGRLLNVFQPLLQTLEDRFRFCFGFNLF